VASLAARCFVMLAVLMPGMASCLTYDRVPDRSDALDLHLQEIAGLADLDHKSLRISVTDVIRLSLYDFGLVHWWHDIRCGPAGAVRRTGHRDGVRRPGHLRPGARAGGAATDVGPTQDRRIRGDRRARAT